MCNSEKRRVAVQSCKSGMKCLSVTSPGDLPEICRESLDLPFLDPKVHTDGTSNEGLLLLYDAYHLFLCNPTTKHFQFFPYKYPVEKPDPRDPWIMSAGLGYLSESGDYKIVCIYLCDGYDLKMSQADSYDIEVYSFKTGGWNTIRTPLVESFWIARFEPPICVKGRCYWIATGSKVVSFDFSEEKFSYFSLPSKTQEVGRHRHRSCLIKLDNYYDEDLLGIMYYRLRGSASSCFYDGDYYELWVCRGEKWEKDFNVSLTSVFAPLTMIDNRFLFLIGLYDTGKEDDKRNHIVTNGLSVYDHTSKKCFVLGITDNVYVFSYVESFVTLPDGKPIQGSDVLNHDNSLGNNDNAIESTAEEEEEEEEEMEEEEEDEEDEEEHYRSNTSCGSDCPNNFYYRIDKEKHNDFLTNGMRIIETEEKVREDDKETTHDGLLSSL